MSLFEDPSPAAPSGPLVRLLVAYHGGRFRGIAAQPGQRTVAGVLAAALEKVLQAPVELTVAGRTDAGVHAWGQVVGFDAPLAVAGPEVVDDLARRLTRILGPEVVVREAAVALEGFDARRSATGRRYRYTVLQRPEPDPWLADTSWWVPGDLDVRAMQAGCDPLLGTHDFSAFCRRQVRADGEAASLVREVREAGWERLPDGLLRFEVEASSFCQQMVRSLVGTLVEVGQGRRTAADVNVALRSGSRSAAGQVAPPHGLCLWEVTYP